MDLQDNKFNYKIILTALVAIIVGILIAFYYSYAQSANQISFLEQEKVLLVRDLTLMKTDVDRLYALNEVNDIELQDSKYRIQQLLDSVGKLNFSIDKLKEYKTELRKLEVKNDSLKLKNNFLKYNNMLLSNKYEESRKLVEELRGKSSSLAEAEALLRKRNRELSLELKTKNYLKLENSEGSGFRQRSGKPIKTNKANTISKLRGCVTILGNPNSKNEERVLYFQFLGPTMGVIEDNANTISVNGNVYRKGVEAVFMGQEFKVCEVVTVPEGSSDEGGCAVNACEDERLGEASEMQLK